MATPLSVAPSHSGDIAGLLSPSLSPGQRFNSARFLCLPQTGQSEIHRGAHKDTDTFFGGRKHTGAEFCLHYTKFYLSTASGI